LAVLNAADARNQPTGIRAIGLELRGDLLRQAFGYEDRRGLVRGDAASRHHVSRRLVVDARHPAPSARSSEPASGDRNR